MNLVLGNRITVSINDIAFGGEGVARHEDFVVFIPFVTLGELVEAEITEVKKSFARAKLVQVIQASPERVAAQCPYFGTCGGCQYQHIDYQAQIRIKHKQIADLFQRIGGIDPGLVLPVIPCPQPYGYRNRIMIRSQWDKFKQGLNIGFVRHDCGLVVDIEGCKIAEPALNDQILHVRANPPPKGGIKVVLRIKPEGWEVPPDSFFQNNFFLVPKLVEVVGDRLKAAGSRHLIDLYCGVGFFGIELAGQVESFVGVEYDRMAIRSAQKNAATRQIRNGEFLAGPSEEMLPGLMSRFKPEATTVLIDPPRKGCQPQMLETLRSMRPAQVIYVSCHPATMARDLNILCAESVFTVAKVTPLDMFPQTAHVECVADVQSAGKQARP